jgi:SH3-like domain-containing protein
MTMMMCASPAAAQDRQPPYWASIASGEAMMRTGPARTYPGIWLYQRRDLPVRVLKRYESWRLIEDPDGARGWMLSTMLSDRRTAMVRPGDPRPIRVQPDSSSPARYLAEPGVVGQISQCHQLHRHRGRFAAADAQAGDPALEAGFLSALSRVTMIRAPLAPIGWPSAVAPPWTLILSCGMPRSRIANMATQAKASLTSNRSTSSTLQPAFRAPSDRADGRGGEVLRLLRVGGHGRRSARPASRPLSLRPRSGGSAPARRRRR